MSFIEKINEVTDQHKHLFEGTNESVPDWFIANELNKQPIILQKKYEAIDCKDVKAMLIVEGKYSIIKELSISGSSEIKELCSTILDILNGFDTMNMNIPEYLSSYIRITNILESTNIITTDIKQRILSFIIEKDIEVVGLSWSQINNIQVDARSVGIARGAKP